MPRRLVFVELLIVAMLVACGVPTDSPQTSDNLPQTPVIILSVATPSPTPTSTAIIERYTVRPGDTLSGISQRFDISVEDLMKLNGLTDPNALKIGQSLKITTQVTRAAPADRLLPDSEVVYGPAYTAFDVAAFANQYNGYLAAYREKVEGEMLSGPQIIQLVAERFSVGPRVLLTLLESQSGWVTNALLTQNQVFYPMGLVDSTRSGLFFQTSWAANHLNEGYYGKLSGQLAALKFKDRSRARLAPSLNPGTAAIQNVLAQTMTWDAWQNQIGQNGFIATYRRLFGDPNGFAVDPLIPSDLRQPPLRLPWNDGAMWYYSGGPHSGWGDLAAWVAVDFTPNDIAGSGSCATSREWVIAAAPGKVIRAERGRVMVSLSNNNFQGSGWTLLYMHIANIGRVNVGVQLNAGDRIGRPSCEGGNADASHVHFARLYNGQWIATDTAPFVLSGWTVTPLEQEYAGKLSRGSESREACNCRDDAKNGIVADAGTR